MESDLLFTLIDKSQWKTYSASGEFSPPEYEEAGYIRCYDSKEIEEAANLIFPQSDELFLIVIDPLRIHHPIKRTKTAQGEYLDIFGSFSIDAIIDKIPLKRSKNGRFFVHIKHFD